jgi:hypothetical protein
MGKMKSAWMAEVGYGYKAKEVEEVDSQLESNYPNKINDPYNLWDDDGGEIMISEQDLGALMAKWEDL